MNLKKIQLAENYESRKHFVFIKEINMLKLEKKIILRRENRQV